MVTMKSTPERIHRRQRVLRHATTIAGYARPLQGLFELNTREDEVKERLRNEDQGKQKEEKITHSRRDLVNAGRCHAPG
jgi:hypothetical protein